MTARVIGVSGFAGSGKSTVAEHLAKAHGYEVVSRADPLRAAATALDPIVGTGRGGRLVRYLDVLALYGYDRAKTHPVYGGEVRRTLQRMGTEVGREVFGSDFWVEQLVGRLDPRKWYVVPDTRFVNEADAIRHRLAGALVRVERPRGGAGERPRLGDRGDRVHVRRHLRQRRHGRRSGRRSGCVGGGVVRGTKWWLTDPMNPRRTA
jgi:hypothetical protein